MKNAIIYCLQKKVGGGTALLTLVISVVYNWHSVWVMCLVYVEQPAWRKQWQKSLLFIFMLWWCLLARRREGQTERWQWGVLVQTIWRHEAETELLSVDDVVIMLINISFALDGKSCGTKCTPSLYQRVSVSFSKPRGGFVLLSTQDVVHSLYFLCFTLYAPSPLSCVYVYLILHNLFETRPNANMAYICFLLSFVLDIKWVTNNLWDCASPWTHLERSLRLNT